ncbi:YpmS family protein [Cytobacillus purgationiresistens]|nr:YpmS family protein [Cytobacillus purgationiresistens]
MVKWKHLFFILLGAVVSVVLILIIMMSIPPKDDQYRGTSLDESDYAPFNISTNKHDLNLLINHYLEEEILEGAMDYKVLLDEEVDLYGTLPIFSQNLQLKLSFESMAMENGDIVLQQKGISVGQMDLPISFVMKLIKDNYNIPDWVVIQPNEERIYVALTEMELKSDVKVKVDQFDLKNDEIQFTLLVPVK